MNSCHAKKQQKVIVTESNHFWSTRIKNIYLLNSTDLSIYIDRFIHSFDINRSIFDKK